MLMKSLQCTLTLRMVYGRLVMFDMKLLEDLGKQPRRKIRALIALDYLGDPKHRNELTKGSNH